MMVANTTIAGPAGASNSNAPPSPPTTERQPIPAARNAIVSGVAENRRAAAAGTIDNDSLDFIYRGGGAGVTEETCGAETGLACDRIITPNHFLFGNVLFGDGHVVGFTGDDWATEDNTHNTGGWPIDPH